MTQYTEFVKQYADDNALSYKQAMKEAKEKRRLPTVQK